MAQSQTVELRARQGRCVCAAEGIADEIAAHPDDGSLDAPIAELQAMAAQGLLTAPLPSTSGGLGFGTEHGGHGPLLRTLAAIGGADLALGRLYEGHVNALILIASFGTPQQLQQAAEAAQAGLLFGVWNTGEGEPMSITASPGVPELHGCKGFATGAAHVRRPIITAERNGWQMALPRMELPQVASAVRLDRRSWQPFGMESSESYTIDLTGAQLAPTDLIGDPGDFYRDPLFRGGAIRFAAVQAGALVRLARLFAGWLQSRGRAGDPFQVARLGEITLAAQNSVLWIERAAAVAEDGLWPGASPRATQRMVNCANMTRLAIERLATATMPRIIAGVGAHGLLRPARFARMLRDLTMYLRQPNPDGTLVDLGRSALSDAQDSFWNSMETR